MMVVSAATAIIAHEQQQKSADAQEKIIKDGYDRERNATMRQYQDQHQVAMEDQSELFRSSKHLENRLIAIGAESGLMGVSNDRLVAEAEQQSDRDAANIEANLTRGTAQANTLGLARQTQANTQLSGIRRPSALGTGLQIASGAVQSYGKYSSLKPPNTTTPQR